MTCYLMARTCRSLAELVAATDLIASYQEKPSEGLAIVTTTFIQTCVRGLLESTIRTRVWIQSVTSSLLSGQLYFRFYFLFFSLPHVQVQPTAVPTRRELGLAANSAEPSHWLVPE